MDPEPPEPAPAPQVPPVDRPRHAIPALSIGAAAIAAFLVQLMLGVQYPWVVLIINLGLAAGAYGVLLLHDALLREAGAAGILQFMGFVAIALLGRVWLGQTAQGFAILFEYSLSLGALAIVIACVLFRVLSMRLASRHAALTNATIGGLGLGLLVTSLLATSPTRQEANLTLLGLTCIIVPCLLGLQWAIARRQRSQSAKALATPLALALAGTQLFDGVLTYLVVVDPLGMAPAGYEEQIPVSRLILDRFGIGFPILKWALGIIMALILAQARFPLATYRVVMYVAVLAAGMGPGLFSASQLL